MSETITTVLRSPGCEHQRQFIDESFALAANDGAVILDLLRAICDLDGIPSRDMQVLTGAETPSNMPLTAHSAIMIWMKIFHG